MNCKNCGAKLASISKFCPECGAKLNVQEEKENKKSDTEAINIAYDRSWNAIRDGQISTWMIWLLLMLMWINMFKWFGTMLVVWVLLTLFINAPVIKELLHIFYRKK